MTMQGDMRRPAVAGQFYPDDPRECRAEAQGYLDQAATERGSWIGAVAPHAGWAYSGAIAGKAIAALAAGSKANLVVVFGATHTPARFDFGALDSHAQWSLPLGASNLPVELEQSLLAMGNLFAVEPRLHAREHAIEVEVPLIQLAWPGAMLLPIEVPPTASAGLIGRKTAQAVGRAGLRAVYVASTDFTHYGPNYGFAPAGTGTAAMQWAKDNDKPLLELIEKLEVDKIVPEAMQRQSACGAGAIAAMLAACREEGATLARILEHATSYETVARRSPQPPTNAVGYAAVVVG
jgi:MEMO1 family protein